MALLLPSSSPLSLCFCVPRTKVDWRAELAMALSKEGAEPREANESRADSQTDAQIDRQTDRTGRRRGSNPVYLPDDSSGSLRGQIRLPRARFRME